MNKQLIFNSKPYIINNKNYSSIQFTLFFPIPYDKQYIGYTKLLKQLLTNTSLEYKTEESYNKAYKEKMIISLSAKSHRFNNNKYIEFNLIVPDPKKVKDYDLESAFKFFIDTIYKPNIENEEFNNYYFEREKKFVKETILEKRKNIYYIAEQNFFNYVDDIGIIKDNLSNNLELLDNITPKDLYQFYKRNIVDNTPIIIAYGDIDESINTLINKYMNIQNKDIIINKDYYNFLIPFEKTHNIEEESKFYQSILYTSYKIKNMTEKDIIYFFFLTDLIDANKLLFINLRNKENLIYHVSTMSKSKIGLYTVITYIDSTSKDKVIDTINNTFKSLYDKTLLEKYKNKLLDNLKCSQIRTLDQRNKKLADFIVNSFEFDLTLEELIEQYKNLNLDEFYNFLDRFTLDTTYFLRGEYNGK